MAEVKVKLRRPPKSPKGGLGEMMELVNCIYVELRLGGQVVEEFKG